MWHADRSDCAQQTANSSSPGQQIPLSSFITLFTTDRLGTVSFHPCSRRSLLTLPASLYLGLPKEPFPSGFSTESRIYFSIAPSVPQARPIAMSSNWSQSVCPSPITYVKFCNTLSALRWGVVSPSSNTQNWRTTPCPPLRLIQHGHG